MWYPFGKPDDFLSRENRPVSACWGEPRIPHNAPLVQLRILRTLSFCDYRSCKFSLLTSSGPTPRINSTEYCILLAYRREHSDLNVSYWKEKHTHKCGMSYGAMEKFIGLYSDSEERLKQFAAMRKCFAKQDRSYFRMKEWFKENYPDYEEQNHQMDEDGFLVAKETADVGA